MVMMAFEPELPRRRIRAPFVASFCLHAAVFGLLAYKPEPQLLKPVASLRGDGGSGNPAIALVGPGTSALTLPKIVEEEFRKKDLVTPSRNRRLRPKRPKPESQPALADKNLRPGMPGYILGSLSSGIISNRDVRIALPVHAPDPPIVRAKLPEWIRGDVIVEVTISETGETIEAIVLETVGYGLEQVVVETLKKWRWIPATIDGMKVASKQDVRFHFPS